MTIYCALLLKLPGELGDGKIGTIAWEGTYGNIMTWMAYLQQIEKKVPQLSGREGLFVLAVSVHARSNRYHA